MFKKICITLLSILMFLETSFNNVYAEKIINSYTFSSDTLESSVYGNYISSIMVERVDDNTWKVLVGDDNTSYEAGMFTGTSGSVEYKSKASDIQFTIEINLETKTALIKSGKSKKREVKKHTIAVKMYPSPESEDLSMWADIYVDGSVVDTRKTEVSGNRFDFGSYSKTFNNLTLSFDEMYVEVNTASNKSKGVITYWDETQGEIITETSDMGSAYRSIVLFMETLVTSEEINELDYLSILPNKPYTTLKRYLDAGKEDYTTSQIDAAVASATITLYNVKTEYHADERLLTEITVWNRVGGTPNKIDGTGIYDTTPLGKYRVICQWNDSSSDCTGNEDFQKYKSSNPRYYAVFANNYSYTSAVTKNETHTQNVYKQTPRAVTTTFPTIEYSDDIVQASYRTNKISYTDWSEAVIDDNPSLYDAKYSTDSNLYQQIGSVYKYRTGDLTYGDWSEDYTSSCTSSYTEPHSLSETGKQVTCSAANYKVQYKRTISYGSWENTGTYAKNQTAGTSFYPTSDGNELRWVSGYIKKTTCKTQNVTYSDFGSYSTSKYGDYTGQCKSRTGKNSECGVASYSYSNYGTYQDKKYGSYTSECKSKEVDNTSSCKLWAQSGSKCGYAYSNYGYYYTTIGHYNCGSKITSGSNKGKYYCASTRTASRCQAAGCETYNKKTQYSCPSTRSVSSYNSCTSYSCPSTRTVTGCASWNDSTYTTSCTESQYNTTCDTGYYAYQKRSVTYGNNVSQGYVEESSCKSTTPSSGSTAQYSCGSATYKLRKTRSMSIGNLTDWSGWVTSVPASALNKLYFEQKASTKYKWRTAYQEIGDWSDWFETKSEINVTGREYRYRTVQQTPTTEQKTGQYVSKGTETIGTLTKQTDTTINTQKTKMNEAYAKSVLAENLLNKDNALAKKYNSLDGTSDTVNEEGVLLENYNRALNANSSAISSISSSATSGDKWVQSSLFVPFLYRTRHVRANYKEIDNALGADSPSDVMENSGIDTTEIITNLENISGELIENVTDTALKTKVTYINYKDPLSNYDGDLPENWGGDAYEKFVEAVQNSIDKGASIKVTISKQDMLDMREYLDEHPEGISDCSFLREFSYIFDSTDEAVQEFLDGSKSCRLTNDD